MIKSIACKHTRALHETNKVHRQFRAFARPAKRKLMMLNAATKYHDLTSPPGNRLEKLSGDRAGQSSIRINGQWRLCFRWHEGNATHVEICDTH